MCASKTQTYLKTKNTKYKDRITKDTLWKRVYDVWELYGALIFIPITSYRKFR